MIESSRRGFITDLIGFAATAPAIVRSTSLMPVKASKLLITEYYNNRVIRHYMDVEAIRDRPAMQIYGRSPAMDALPDLMTIQRISREFAREVFLPTYHGVAIREVDELDGWAGMRGR